MKEHWLALLVAFLLKGIVKMLEFLLDRGFNVRFGFQHDDEGNRKFGINVKLNAFTQDGQVDIGPQAAPATGYGPGFRGGATSYYGGPR